MYIFNNFGDERVALLLLHVVDSAVRNNYLTLAKNFLGQIHVKYTLVDK